MSDKEPTIVIVKRHGGHEDDHHGGAWKIAFADFMTAMMAFFLVLWIVNSTNKETRTVIARYFNPLKLEDMSRSKKGIGDDKLKDDAGKGADAAGGKATKEATTPSSPASGPVPPAAPAPADGEAAMMADPAAALEALAAKDDARRAAEAPTTGFQDPFRQPVRMRPESRDNAPAKPNAAEKQAQRLAEEIAELAREAGAAPGVRVRATEEGLMISLTDDVNFAMFNVGSAQPEARIIRLMAGIAAKLKATPGAVILRGHTDARPFRSRHYDNWRLSSMRAQMAAYMLMRGGLPEDRVMRVEGHAERKPVNAGDPLAPENRRIEILLRRDQP